MIVVPAVDLKGGRCVQLVGGRPEDERVSLPDPVAVARSWRARGFSSLHIVDLDAALGTGDNADTVDAILGASAGDVQVGGGIRSTERATTTLKAGAARIIVGTRALDDPEWLGALARDNPGRVVVALDSRDGQVLRRGWTADAGLEVTVALARLSELPLAGFLSTDVGREGRLEGIDEDGARRILEASTLPVWMSGGITSISDLEALEALGAYGAVLGMTLYTESLDVDAVAARWGGSPRTRFQSEGDTP